MTSAPDLDAVRARSKRYNDLSGTDIEDLKLIRHADASARDVPDLLAEIDRLERELADKTRWLHSADASYARLCEQAEDMRRALRMPDPLKPYPHPPVTIVPAEVE